MPRKIGNQRRHLARSLFVSFLLLAILTVVAVNIFADIITDNDVEVRLNSRLTYYLTVQEDGVEEIYKGGKLIYQLRCTGGRIE